MSSPMSAIGSEPIAMCIILHTSVTDAFQSSVSKFTGRASAIHLRCSHAQSILFAASIIPGTLSFTNLLRMASAAFSYRFESISR